MSNEKTQIIQFAKRLNDKNMLAAGDGNISFRLDAQEILITPSGLNKSMITEKDFASISMEGEVISGKPSSEREMHLAVYQNCEKAKAVIHAHPPTAIAWSIAQPELKELPNTAMSELILSVGRIPIVPYARPGTKDMGEALATYLPQHRVMILARHGALSWGETLEEAYNGMERLEHTAQILKIAKELGGISQLPPTEIEYLLNLRKQLGDKTL